MVRGRGILHRICEAPLRRRAEAILGDGGRQIAEKRIARSRPRERNAIKQITNKQRCAERFNFKLTA
jgi:hypothetical protein